ncbi:MAG: hypothetical protein HYS27_17745 [Deltaproteobacteria bacterium]|nr:hypothetical protein [Deltaproteobacteria bacterium]
MSHTPDAGKPKQKMSGCMLAVIIVGGLALLFAIGIVVTVVAVLRTPEGSAVVDLMTTSIAAQKGPGADALRAQGCQSIGVLPVAALNDIAARADAGPVIPDVATAMVSCFSPPADRTCPPLAAAYVAAERPSGPIRFAIVDGEHDRCAGYFDASGQPMATPAEAPAP